MISIRKDKLLIRMYDSREEMGKAAAADAAEKIKELLKKQAGVRMVFAAAPSQNEFLSGLLKIEGIDYGRITAFHMDEYIGLDKDAPQGFGNFLRARLFSKKTFGAVHFIDGQAADPQAECERYAALINEAPIDIVCMGIGENAHIAFNDPPFASFDDPETVRVVTLEEKCRVQQVNDGCFDSLDKVPVKALTLTIPPLIKAKYIFCMVPAATKADAVYNSLINEVSAAYPASVLRTCPDAVLYLDPDSGGRIKEIGGAV